MSPNSTAAILAIACVASLCQASPAAELAPNDPSIAADLALWLTAPDIDYDQGAGQWTDSSGKGNDAIGIGTVGAVEWSTPILSTVSGGALTPSELDSVHFSGSANDILATAGLNGGSGLSELTIIAVYAVSNNSNLTRPVGFGSLAASQANPGDHFNLASDPSVRKDNGAITGHSSSIPLDTPLIRSARMQSSGVDEWFNDDGSPEMVIDDGGSGYTTSTDQFYLGDLRAGATPVPGFGASVGTAEIDVIEIIVYTSALPDQQIADINEWLVANLGGAAPPNVTAFTASPSLIASGGSSMLTWQVERADSVTITPSVGTVDVDGSVNVSPSTTTTYTLTASGEGGVTESMITVGVDVPVEEPSINEILAINNNSLDDEDGDSSDWIELHNPNPFSFDLGGYFLSDAPLNPTKWQLPAGTNLGAGGHLVVFASGKDRAAAGSELHTNFRLDSSGEGLSLIAPDGSTVISQIGFPSQIPDISYGVDDTD
ncbi:MAG: lamin tail domain-containing protein, partial [Verrucomicrobiales bacterium]